MKELRSVIGHANFYQRSIKDFSKISKSLYTLLEKYLPFKFYKKMFEAFWILKEKLVSALVVIAPYWRMLWKHKNNI